jgi:type II secretory pathway pseudopilin PulG
MAFCAWCGNRVSAVSYAACPGCGNPTNGAQRVPGGEGSNTTVMVLGGIGIALVLLAVVGIVAAIAIPNFLTAQGRARQKRTLADLRRVGAAMEAYKADHPQLPRASSTEELAPLLVPRYIDRVPYVDAWATPLAYDCWPAGGCTHYAIVSAGRDKQLEEGALERYNSTGAITTKDFDADIVWMDGKFTQLPEGSR